MFERTVTTLLFVDIVSSTERAVALGDARWRELLDHYQDVTSKELRDWGGREVFTKGDEVVAAFDSAARAIRCACALREDARSLGLSVRAGVHAGEVDRRGDSVSGIAVHIGQRVSTNAAPDEVLVSPTVKDLVAGSEISFAQSREHQLKGLAGTWQLYAVADSSDRTSRPEESHRI
jgi:class 3 adenylate cyclase